MINKAIEIATSEKFIRFFVVGVTAFILDNLVLNFLTFVVFGGEEKNISLFVVGAISFGFALEKILSSIVGSTTSFLLNRYWAFKATHEGIKKQAVKFFSIVLLNAVLGAFFYLIYESILDLYFDFFGSLIPTFANVATTGTIMLVSYFFYSTFVFRELKPIEEHNKLESE